MAHGLTTAGGAVRITKRYGMSRGDQPYSGLILAVFITLPHFSVSSVMNFPKSAGERACTSPPSSESLALILGSVSPALIAWLSLSMTSVGVSLGAPTPLQPLVA